MQLVLIDEGFGHFDKGDRAGEAAVVPPIGFESGHAVFVASVIYGGYNKITAFVNGGSYVAVEAGVSTFVLTDLLPVDPEPGAIVGRAYVQKDARVCLWLIREVALV